MAIIGYLFLTVILLQLWPLFVKLITDKGSNMKVRTLASSSSGNCIIIVGDNSIILIDAGIKLEDLEIKFKALDLSLSQVSGVLLTHEHSDHIKSIGPILRKYKIPTYIHNNTVTSAIKKMGKVNKDLVIPIYEEPFELGEFVVKAFSLPHDASFCVGYNIIKDNKKISIALDFGYATENIVQNLYGSKLVILESNHDEKMLLANPNYSALLKARILGKNGHLSNNTAAKIICDLATKDVKQVVLAHLSEENNTPTLALETIKSYLDAAGLKMGQDINVDIADPYLIGPAYNIT